MICGLGEARYTSHIKNRSIRHRPFVPIKAFKDDVTIRTDRRVSADTQTYPSGSIAADLCPQPLSSYSSAYMPGTIRFSVKTLCWTHLQVLFDTTKQTAVRKHRYLIWRHRILFYKATEAVTPATQLPHSL